MLGKKVTHNISRLKGIFKEGVIVDMKISHDRILCQVHWDNKKLAWHAKVWLKEIE